MRNANTYDYCYFASFYLFMRIIIICIHFAPYEVTLILQLNLLILFGGMIMIFWPFQRNINTFC